MQRKSNETLCKEKEQSVPALAQALVVAMETANSYAVGSTAGGGYMLKYGGEDTMLSVTTTK